ncbi:MAG TPA: hypothetical protein PKL85_10470 [Bacteroidia bacterium]|nr:hypothetical protein [Bacteroidia bacterium]
MKFRSMLVLVALFASYVSTAQVKFSKEFKITVGEPYKVVDAKSKEYFGDGEGHIVTVKTDGELIVVQRFNVSDGKEIGRKEYKDQPDKSELQSVFNVGGKLFYIYTVAKKGDLFDVFCREVNMKQGSMESAKLLFTSKGDLARTEPKETLGAWGLQRGPFLTVYKSFDDSKVLINYRRIPLIKSDAKNKDILGFYVFDNTMKSIWGDEVTMPHTEKEMNNLAYTVTKDGTARMLAYLNEAKSFELINIAAPGKLSNMKVDIDGNLKFQRFNVKEDNSGNLVCTGFYAKGIDVKVSWTGSASLSWNIDGLKIFKMDSQGKVLDNKDFEFPIAMLNQFESKRQQEKNEKREGEGKAGIPDLVLRDVSVDADGNTMVIGEQHYIRTERTINGTQTVYFYGDMVATRIDKDGKLMWMKKLPKDQTGYQGKGGMGFRLVVGKTATYFLYLDNKKNAELSVDKAPAKHSDGKGGYFFAYKLENATGDVSKHVLFDTDDLQGEEIYQFNTGRIFEPSPDIFFLESYMKKKQDKMIRMELTTK